MQQWKRVINLTLLEVKLAKIAAMAFILLVAKFVRQKYGWDMVRELDYWLLVGIVVVFGYAPMRKIWSKR